MAKIRRFPLLCLLLVLLLTPFSAWAEGRVFLAGEADPFPKDAELLTLRVADVFGGDCMLMTWREETLMIDAGESFFFPAIQRLLSEAGSPDHVDTPGSHQRIFPDAGKRHHGRQGPHRLSPRL